MGVYAIKNKINGMQYIGKAFDINKRRYQHFLKLKKGTHENQKLQFDFIKYGEDNFEFIVIEKTATKEDLLPIEKERVGRAENKKLYNERLTATPKEGLSTFIEKKTHNIVVDDVKRRRITKAEWVKEAVLEKIERDGLL